MRLADYVIRRLAGAGVEHAFTVCGGGSIFLNDALGKGPMKYVCTHHEQAAGFAAVAYARARDGLGLAVVTSGPGGTNAVTACADAWLDHVSVVFLSGQVFGGQTIGTRAPGLRTLGVQEINIIDVVRPITKHAVMVRDPAMIRFELERALYLARDGRPGPVWLDIPADVQNAQVDPERLLNYPRPSVTWFPEEAVKEVLALLQKARRPLLHVGQGVRLSPGGLPALLRFAESAGIPILTARNGNDLIPSEHRLYVGRPGTFSQRAANFAVQSCDLYVAVGTRLSLAQTGYNARDYARQAKVVHVDIDRAELEKDTVPVDLKVWSDAGDFLRAMTEAAGLVPGWPDWSAWLARCKDLQERYPPVTADQRERREGRTVNSYHLIDELSDQLSNGDIVVTDVGFAYQNTHQAFRVKRGQRLLSSNGLAPMGWGLPAAIGAAVGTGRRVVCVTGDGGLMMNVQELATVAHNRLPIKIFLLNNGGYLTMRQSQAHAFESYMGSDEASGISFPGFEKLAASFGVHYLRLESPRSVRGFVQYALACEGPVFVEVIMDRDQETIPKSVNRRLPDGTIQQTALEDMAPHLTADEIAAALRCS